MPFPREYVQRLFDSIAPRYDSLNRLLSLRLDTWWRRRLVHSLEPHHPGAVLDVATGTGDVLLSLRSIHPTFTVGTDLSSNMLALARPKLKSAGTIFVQSAAEYLPFCDRSFDLVTVAFGVRNFSDLERALQECHRVLKPGGKIRILEFSRPTGRLWGSVFGFYFRTIVPVVGGWISGQKAAYAYLPDTVATFPNGSAFAAKLTEAGFANVFMEPMTGGVVTLYCGSTMQDKEYS